MANSKRILPRKAKQEQSKVTHEQVAEAIRRFQDNGGLIRRLPSQGAQRREVVGHHWEGMYESLVD